MASHADDAVMTWIIPWCRHADCTTPLRTMSGFRLMWAGRFQAGWHQMRVCDECWPDAQIERMGFDPTRWEDLSANPEPAHISCHITNTRRLHHEVAAEVLGVDRDRVTVDVVFSSSVVFSIRVDGHGLSDADNARVHAEVVRRALGPN